MTVLPARRIANMGAQAALPRKNGELVFETPWEGRAFGLAVALNRDGHYGWRDFRDRLVVEFAAAEKSGVPSSCCEQWLASLEKLVVAKGLVAADEMNARTAEYVAGQRDEDHG